MEKLNKLLEEYPNWKWDLDSLKFLKPFIKWLVDNDKIDRHNVWYSTMLWQLSDYHWLDWEQELLMLLSIQDNPIEFLCSVLK